MKKHVDAALAHAHALSAMTPLLRLTGAERHVVALALEVERLHAITANAEAPKLQESVADTRAMLRSSGLFGYTQAELLERFARAVSREELTRHLQDAR